MKTPNLFAIIIKKIQIPGSIIMAILTFVGVSIGIFTDIRLFLSGSKNEQTESSALNKKIQIETGETKLIFDNDLLQITIDDISLLAGTNLYKMVGKIDNGIITNSDLEMAQGESTIFDKYIIQTTKIASDYVIFRVSLRGKN